MCGKTGFFGLATKGASGVGKLFLRKNTGRSFIGIEERKKERLFSEGEMVNRNCCFLIMIVSSFIMGSSAFAETKTPTTPCVNPFTGNVKIKRRCDISSGEYVLNINQLKGETGAPGPAGPQGPSGLNLLNCTYVTRWASTQVSDDDIVNINLACPQGYFVLTHGGYSSTYDAVISTAQLTFWPGTNIPGGVNYSFVKAEPILSFNYTSYATLSCCPIV
jgi:hypothetical protein